MRLTWPLPQEARSQGKKAEDRDGPRQTVSKLSSPPRTSDLDLGLQLGCLTLHPLCSPEHDGKLAGQQGWRSSSALEL